MKKLLLGVLSVLCMQSVFAADVKQETNQENYPMNIDAAYRIDIKKLSGDKESNYQAHIVSGRVSYFNEMRTVNYISEVKCKNENECETIKGSETVGTSYIVDLMKPKSNKEDVVVFLQINEKEVTGQKKVCEAGDKKCVDLLDISILNFKEALKMKDGQSKTVQYNNLSYTVTVTKE